jgi:two-component sensor histidine kinase
LWISPGNLSFLLKIYFIAGTIILVTGALWYNSSLISRMKTQSETTTRLFSRFIAIALRDVDDEAWQEFVLDIRSAITLPFVLSDEAGRPLVWNGIGVPMVSDDEFNRIIDYNPQQPNDPLLEKVQKIAESLDRVNRPIDARSENIALVIHYGESRLSRELRVAPYIQLGVFIIFILLGFLGFKTVKTGEQRSIWVGMAKEAAHQLGTPLSSIMGWLAIIRQRAEGSDRHEELTEPVTEAMADVDRLSRISSRFSKIGSTQSLEYQELAPIIEETVEYFERRRPALQINSTIEVDLDELPLMRCSSDLMTWVFENLIKNSLDAIAENDGKIHIEGRLNRKENRIEVQFSDNGKGMNSGLRKKAFAPGITTKRRGWGLGLSLVKRIVEEIHGGSIRISHSQPGKGTTFQITFPVD